MDRFIFSGHGSYPTRMAGAENLTDGSGKKRVFWLTTGMTARTRDVILLQGATCSNCTELQIELTEDKKNRCSPLIMGGYNKGPYTPVIFDRLDIAQAVCPLYSTQNPVIVVNALRDLPRTDLPLERITEIINILDRYPNHKL